MRLSSLRRSAKLAPGVHSSLGSPGFTSASIEPRRVGPSAALLLIALIALLVFVLF